MTLPADPASAVARAGVDPTAEPQRGAPARNGAVADRGGDACCDADAIGWRVDHLASEAETFRGRRLPEALAWCLVWLMAEELGAGLPV